MKANQQKVKCLCSYEETIGTLSELTTDQGFLIARVSKVRLALPIEMENKLLPMIGTRIGILRTDLPGKEYLFRVIADKEKTALMRENARAPESCEAST